MIIWSGWGFVVAIIGFACLVLTEWSVESFFRDDQYYQDHRWPMAVGFALAALCVAVFSLLLDRRKRKVLIDPETGEEHVLSGNDSLFFAPAWSWPWILAVIAGGVLVSEFVK